MKRRHWLLPCDAQSIALSQPERSAINLGLWLWPPLQFLYSLQCLRWFSRPLLYHPANIAVLYDVFFVIQISLFALNLLGLFRLARGDKSGFHFFYYTAVWYLPLSFVALYSLRLLAESKQASRNFNEGIVRRLLSATALSVVCALGLLIAFILFRSLVAMPLVAIDPKLGLWQRLALRLESWSFFFQHSSLWDFLFSTDWEPSKNPPSYGILGFIWGSIQVTLLALLLSVPLGVGSAIFIAEFSPPRVAKMLRYASELLAGLPSVVYGFFGSILVVPLVRTLFPSDLNTGFNAISGGIILAFMILPTIINISEVALRSVPQALRAGSLALGATQWQTVSQITVPAAISGILTSIVLGSCRAIGETLAVLMVAGNAIKFAVFPLEPTRTLTMNIIAEMAYAQDDPASGSYHLTSLFTTSIVLMLFIFSLNLFLSWIRKRIQRRFNPS